MDQNQKAKENIMMSNSACLRRIGGGKWKNPELEWHMNADLENSFCQVLALQEVEGGFFGYMQGPLPKCDGETQKTNRLLEFEEPEIKTKAS